MLGCVVMRLGGWAEREREEERGSEREVMAWAVGELQHRPRKAKAKRQRQTPKQTETLDLGPVNFALHIR